jgi:probable phosphoglycerate mutase
LKVAAREAVAVYSSPLSRAWDTAGHIGESLGIAPEKLAPLAEWDAGDWEGMQYSEIPSQKAFSLEGMREPGFCPPGGESLGDVQARVVRTFREAAERHRGEQIVMVSHGTALALAFAELIDGSMGAWMGYRLANCSVSELMLGAESELIYVNETGHL